MLPSFSDLCRCKSLEVEDLGFRGFRVAHLWRLLHLEKPLLPLGRPRRTGTARATSTAACAGPRAWMIKEAGAGSGRQPPKSSATHFAVSSLKALSP